ncbi:ABC-F family ATP-binding cassette domain-containing protein [Aeriscardovia aeriphila]|uniref:ABC transporter ATP-binding protein n=1 Tax=Aeriscardovia aeriphila TaxID=218139 RepID=A0A261FCY3_9BIFI|nr:ABC-F family ATP-binding cassette domain-containing protein [Aeriscardovia aeriphila]NYI26211.1 ATPase subunit of ABC transporter with duplicated ATPase domains [Aeriscardovia aeriphila]OZG56756.1 ABC transporter ATP-binding protein [Aeriscardovia aeriphila]
MPIFDCGIEHVSLAYATKTVFVDQTQGVNEGDRIGIVGRNGDGKSTLLRLMGGLMPPDSGRVIRRNGLRMGILGQTDQLDGEATIREAALENREDHEWAADPRSREIVQTLLADIPLDARVNDLSGGQRRRADLARLLLHDWDILALDEPTNHLDIVTIHWLAEHLKNRWSDGQGALLVVTHDRWFLDEVCTSMWEVHDGVIDPFVGGYSAYILQRVERDRQAQVSETKRRNLARKELAWLTRGARARSTKQKFHVKAAEALIADVPPVRNSVELKAMATSRLGKDVVTLQDVTKTYPLHNEKSGEITSTDNLEKPAEKTVIKDLTWIIGPGDRFGIVGANGAGKSTLLGLIDGSIAPTSGRVKIGKTVKFAVLSQRLDEVTKLGDAKVKEVLTRYKSIYVVDGKEYTPAKLLERLGFDAAQMMTPVCDLSGGQKRRMQLMLILLDEPNVLILDEPGNDLDTDMLAVMEDLLDDWPGTLIVVSHDRFLLERVTDHQFALINGTVRHLPGGVDDYLNVIEKRRKQVGLLAAEGVAPAADTALSLTASESERVVLNGVLGKPAAVGMPAGLTDSLVSVATDAQAEESKEEKRKKFDARKRQTAIMRKIDKLEADLADLDRKMADASDAVGAASGDALQEELKKLADLTAQHESVGKEKAQLEDEWMQLGEFLEE